MVLNPLSNIQPPDSGSEQIEQAKPAALDAVVEKAYSSYLGLHQIHDNSNTGAEVRGLERQILSPYQINGLLQVIIKETEPDKLSNGVTGLYISRLIQDSYDAGNNDFVLTTEDTQIDNLGSEISGKKYRKLKLQIESDVGILCGYKTKYCEIKILGSAAKWCGYQMENGEITTCGNVGEGYGYGAKYSKITAMGSAEDMCGARTEHSEIKIYGNVENRCGDGAEYSSIVVLGDAKEFCGWFAYFSKIVVYGNVGFMSGGMAHNSEINVFGRTGKDFGIGAEGTLFKLQDEDSYEAFKNDYPPYKYRDNRLRLINSEGKVIRRLPKWLQTLF